MVVVQEIATLLSEHSKGISKERLEFIISKAISLIPNPSFINNDNVLRLSKNLISTEPKQANNIAPKTFEILEIEDNHPISIKKKRTNNAGRKPLFRGKLIQGGTKKTVRDFWLENVNPIDIAKDDTIFASAQPGDNYRKTKQFLKEDWKDKELFTLPELIEALTKKYPEKAKQNGKFRVQRWGNAFYWENTGEIATKPLWKKQKHQIYLNIFFVGSK